LEKGKANMMRSMRRKDREKPKDFALAVVDKCAYSVMSMVNPDGSPYCIPLSLAREGEWLYFHSALDGQKIENLRQSNRVCISCVGYVKAIPGDFALEYESAVIAGTASELTDREEKIAALKVISKRYAPDNMEAFDEAIREELDATSVWKIHIDEISGKGRKL
jgi:nitroimidazol reductase NimA-like FMN-containing flavoprotein (pyridoxamine 5'-phosphate oxidase superfamily)